MKYFGRECYGIELVLDIHRCDPSMFTRDSFKTYFRKLCKLIDMEACDLHIWDDVGVPEKLKQTDPKTKGTSAVQFIITSSVVIHALDLLEKVFVNIFSCKKFDTFEAEKFTEKWFKGDVVQKGDENEQ